MVLVELLLDDLVLLGLGLQSLESLVGLKTGLEGTVFLKGIPEIFDLFDQSLNSEHELLLAVSFLLVHLVPDNISLLHKAHPPLVELVLVVALVLVHDLDEVGFEESVHFVDGADLVGEV